MQFTALRQQRGVLETGLKKWMRGVATATGKAVQLSTTAAVNRVCISSPPDIRLGLHDAPRAIPTRFLTSSPLCKRGFSNHFQRNMSSIAIKTDRVSVLTEGNINPNVKAMEYAVRGPLVIRAVEIEKELASGLKKPFTEVIKANIGDAQAMGQKPITFIRQVISLVAYPCQIETSNFPEDVKSRARAILEASKGSAGCYSDSNGLDLIRKDVAQYIERRDGFPSDPDNIVLCAGASEGIRSSLKLLSTTSGERTGIMIPIPQYPLYSASIVEYNMDQVGYYLDEDHQWGLDVAELERSIKEARKHCNVRAIVIINPGNPTGQVLTYQNIVDVIKFAHRENLFIFADEVYQDNVYASDREFHSFKKVIFELGEPYNKMELASFLSCSKGYMGECGLRGGYAEILNLDPAVKALYLKSISAKLCPTVLGQAVMDCVAKTPQPGEPSYELFAQEKAQVLGSLAARAKSVAETFNSMPGMQCNAVQGAMYAFPRVFIPEKAVAKAKSLGQAPDVFYAFQLLEQTGICCVPGSGFGQRPGTYHFRTTILPQPEKLEMMLEKFRLFQTKFMQEYQ